MADIKAAANAMSRLSSLWGNIVKRRQDERLEAEKAKAAEQARLKL